MHTLHVENVVRDYDGWKSAFDKFARFRADHGVVGYRLYRDADDANRISVDLEFGSLAAADAFKEALAVIHETPQSKRTVVERGPVVVRDVIERVVVRSEQ